MIELLVVIAVLMAVPMPALSMAREPARCTACLSNMRQVGAALALYRHEHERMRPKTQAVFDYASPAFRDTVLRLLRPMISGVPIARQGRTSEATVGSV